MRIAITGASGFLGGHLRASLEGAGHVVTSIGRGSASDIQWDPVAGRLDPADLDGTEAIVHLAGESIGGARFLGPQWNETKKQAILQSRIEGTGLIARTAAAMPTPPRVLVSASAQGYYGSRGEEVLTEQSGPGDIFFSEVCKAWEAATAPAAEAGIRVVTTRTGLVVSDGAEAFRRLLLPARLGAGVLGAGRQWWSVVSLTDVVRVFAKAIEDESLAGPVNLVSPEPIRQRDFAQAVGRRIGRRPIIPAPVLGLKMLLGGEFVDNVLMASTRLVPEALSAHGYEFAHASVESILQHMIGD